ncbi:hypothetical protein D1AOALGA4SA_1823 [Olavius algarvensis Delta 1 endosymbiont]|nr:hypothetical protein D1AOALGA4SA_1823 [Olavius algarvensis Delta 1 endosymbiont]
MGGVFDCGLQISDFGIVGQRAWGRGQGKLPGIRRSVHRRIDKLKWGIRNAAFDQLPSAGSGPKIVERQARQSRKKN